MDTTDKAGDHFSGVEQFGYTQQLHRTMGGYTSFALAFSMITITTTVFTLFAQPFQTVGGAAIWLWLPVTVGILIITAVYGHLAARLPVTGYAYQWSSRIVSPHFGWFTGWNAMLATWVGSAGIATALGTVFAPDFWPNPSHANIILLASIGVAIAVVLNIVSIKVASRINNVGATTELIGVLGLIVLMGVGLLFFHHHQSGHILFQVGPTTGAPVTLTVLGLALLLPVYTLAGWEGSADLAEETVDPRRTAPKAMMRSVTISGVAGFLLFAVFALAIPGDLAQTVNATDVNPLVAIFRDHYGVIASDVLQVVAFVSIFSALIANVAVATRTAFSLGRDNMLPFSKIVRRVNPKTGTPIYTTFAVGVFAIVVNLLSSGIVTNVTSVVSVALYLTYGSTLVAVLVGVRKRSIPDAPAGYFTLGRSLVPLCVIGLLWSVVVVAYMILPAVNHTVFIYAAGFQVAGLIWYLAHLRRQLQAGRAGTRALVTAG